MNLLKRPSLLLAVIVLSASSLIFLAQPIIERSANSKQIQAQEEYKQNIENNNFSFDNAYTFYNHLDGYVLPMYINYKVSVEQKSDYDSILSNATEVSIEEKERLHYLIQEMQTTFEANYGKLNYYICDNEQTHVYTNNEKLSSIYESKNITSQEDTWQIILSFNEDGILSIIDYSYKESSIYFPTVEEVAQSIKNVRTQLLSDLQERFPASKAQFQDIKNTTFVLEFDDTMGMGVDNANISIGNYVAMFINQNYLELFIALSICMVIAGILVIKEVPKLTTCKAYRWAAFLPIELLIICWFIVEGICLSFDYATYAPIGAYNFFVGFVVSSFYFVMIATSFAGILAMMFFLGKAKRDGIKQTYKANSILYSGGENFKQNVIELYRYIQKVDKLNMSKKYMYSKVAMHTLIILVLWWRHVLFVIVYIIVFYLVWLKKLRKQQKDYETLQATIHRFCIGDYEEPVGDSLGGYEGLKEDLVSLQEGIKIAIAQEVSSQRMKNELITNVSHDLKTPLTAIISYIDLLKTDEITQADQKKYLHTLEKSADRLKHLIEDLFEISKANSGNLKVSLMEVDLVSLIKQVEMECQTAFQNKHLFTKRLFSDEKILISVDPQKAYRIFENLLSNVGKYALEKTRVFIQVTDYDSRVDIEIKNVSKAELNFSAEEIVERFTRGDKSRNTEGSGLGLAIAKSFTELMQGTMRIELDGDIFKVTVSFYKQTSDAE